MSISEFKATCLAALERVRQTGRPLLITKHGQPVAEVVPPRPAPSVGRNFLGRLRGTGEIVSDLTEPVVSASEFERGGLKDWDEVNR